MNLEAVDLEPGLAQISNSKPPYYRGIQFALNNIHAPCTYSKFQSMQTNCWLCYVQVQIGTTTLSSSRSLHSPRHTLIKGETYNLTDVKTNLQVLSKEIF